MPAKPVSLPVLLKQIRNCKLCEADLPEGANPVVRASRTARILIAGQAPGIRVHRTSIPFNDPSGNRLRDWLQIDSDTFYDQSQVAIVPMGFCYPGTAERGDLPPRKECARTWHQPLLAKLPDIRLTLAIGIYAQAYYLGSGRKKSLTETVRSWREYGDNVMPLPHPSPRNNIWLKRNPWFEQELLPELARRVSTILD